MANFLLRSSGTCFILNATASTFSTIALPRSPENGPVWPLEPLAGKDGDEQEDRMLRPCTDLSYRSTGAILVALFLALGGLSPAFAQEPASADAATAAQEAQDPATTDEADKKEGEEAEKEEPAEEVSETIEVIGYRAALEESVTLKRDAVNTRESIVTEDIGKLPDLNLAEAIQRLPGVAIVREGGEGRQLSVRGLGAEFTQVTLNGMEVPASAGGLDSGGAINRGRSFDFNVFPAEIFSRIDINKTSIASIEEGGVASSVQMYTAGGLETPGMRGSVQVQGGYNDLSEETDPRFTATFGFTNQARTVGFKVAAVSTERNSWQDGFGTVRWQQPDANFRGNQTSFTMPQLRAMWFPRLPRQDSFRHEAERKGLATSLQLRPSERLDINLNYVRSDFQNTTDSYNAFAQFRRSAPWGYNSITPIDLVVEEQGGGQVVVAGSFRGVALRTESRQNEDQTVFDQLTADFSYDLGDNLVLSGMIGRAQSQFEDLQFRVNIETVDPNIVFSYDFRDNPDVAKIDYSIDVTNVANYILQDNELLQKNLVDRTNDTAKLDLDWNLGTGHGLRFGAVYNDREIDSQQFQEDKRPPGVPLASITKVFNFEDVGNFGSGTELDFVVLDFNKAKAAYDFGSNFSAFRGPGRATWVVSEETAGAYAEYNWATQLGDRPLRINAGARYVETKTAALGWLSTTISNTETNSYSNFLPALSAALDITPELVLRAALSRTMTRPDLSSLAPVKAYSDVNFTVTGGNSQLEPLVSDNADLGLEWYFNEKAVLGVAVFYKDIESFISSPQTSEPLRPEDYAAVAAVYPTQPRLLDPSLIWTYRTSANTDGTKLKGFELGYQQTFTGLPGFWQYFGFSGNFSYVDGDTTVLRAGNIVDVPLQGLSENSWNATLFYELPRWAARVSVNNRDDYITNNLGANGNVAEATSGPVRWDMSAVYHFNQHFSLNLEGINLTDEVERLYTTGNGSMDLVREINYSGRQMFLGLRWNL
jgi:iron complex outermembrane receptor protein